MSEEVVQGIVLNTEDRKDDDKIVDLLTAEGIRRAVLKGVKKEKAKLRAFAQPFAFGEFTLAAGAGGFPVVTGGKLTDTFFELTENPSRYFVGCFLLEAARAAAQGGGPAVFVDLLRALGQLAYTRVAPEAVAVKFALRLMSDLGYRQHATKCSCCGAVPRTAYYDALNGGLQCELCHTGRRLPAALATDLAFVAGAEWEELDGKTLPAGDALARFLGAELERLFDVRLNTLRTL